MVVPDPVMIVPSEHVNVQFPDAGNPSISNAPVATVQVGGVTEAKCGSATTG